MKKIFSLVAAAAVVLLAAGCTFSVWEKPVVGVEPRSERDKNGKPVPMFGTVITVHQYGVGGQVQSPPAPPGSPPTPPITAVPLPPLPQEQESSYPTVYPSKWDDPRLVVFMNQSLRPIRIRVDGQQEIRLAAYQATADLKLGVGEHRWRMTVEKSPPPDKLEFTRIPPPIVIHPDGRSQIIYLYDY